MPPPKLRAFFGERLFEQNSNDPALNDIVSDITKRDADSVDRLRDYVEEFAGHSEPKSIASAIDKSKEFIERMRAFAADKSIEKLLNRLHDMKGDSTLIEAGLALRNMARYALVMEEIAAGEQDRTLKTVASYIWFSDNMDKIPNIDVKDPMATFRKLSAPDEHGVSDLDRLITRQ